MQTISDERVDSAYSMSALEAACERAPSFLADDKWAELRHLPLALGFAGAWSMPIRSGEDGKVLGRFGTYCPDVREPTLREIDAVRALTATAAYALEQANIY